MTSDDGSREFAPTWHWGGSDPCSLPRKVHPGLSLPGLMHRDTLARGQTLACIRDHSSVLTPPCGDAKDPQSHTHQGPSKRANRWGPSVSGKHASGVLPRCAILCSALSRCILVLVPNQGSPSIPARPFPLPPCRGTHHAAYAFHHEHTFTDTTSFRCRTSDRIHDPSMQCAT